MSEIEERRSIVFLMVANKIVRSVIHQGKQAGSAINNGFALPPCQYSRPERGNLDILEELERPGDLDWVVLDKFLSIVKRGVVLQKGGKVSVHKPINGVEAGKNENAPAGGTYQGVALVIC